MKKFARILTLMLVLVTMVSLLAIPAAATSDPIEECSLEVEPRYPIPPDCDCGGHFIFTGVSNGYYHYRCSNCGRPDQLPAPY